MTGFSLLLAHLIGDFCLQNDILAANKVNPHPGPEPGYTRGDGFVTVSADANEWMLWLGRRRLWWLGHLACTVHCLLYTASVWAFTASWMPWWGLLVCFVAHWPVDRFRLAAWWMRNVSGQTAFADKMGPWSVIVVDNTFHLLTLYFIALAAGVG